MNKNSIIWLRRDLRLYDNAALFHALKDSNQVFPVFIFDIKILSELKNKKDRRIEFILRSLDEIKKSLNEKGSDLIVEMGDPESLIPKLITEYKCKYLYINRDYEKYAKDRDNTISEILSNKEVTTFRFKDQVLFENNEILTQSNNPYTVFTPYKNNHLKRLNEQGIDLYNCDNHKNSFAKFAHKALPTLEDLTFEKTNLDDLDLPTGTSGGKELLEKFCNNIKNYSTNRNFPAVRGVSYLSVHNRFGTLSIRHLAKLAIETDNDGASTWLSELIWRDFYFQILSNFPHIQTGKAFKNKYNNLIFENDEKKFNAWKDGKTGFPIVDAGMRQLNTTGYMHNRLRMIIACFLVKDLLIDWRWGEAYFAEKLHDYEMASNIGNWQWVAGSGVDAAPYFRIFNPVIQGQKFDADGSYVRKYIPEIALLPDKYLFSPWDAPESVLKEAGIDLGKSYPAPIVDLKQSRDAALKAFQSLSQELS